MSPIIDACVHPFFRQSDQLRDYMKEPFKSRGIPDVELDWYGAPDGEFHPSVASKTGDYPASDPEVVSRHIFDEQGAEIAILYPMTRGNIPDRHLNSAVLAAHNDWLADQWLDKGNAHGRFRGTIRVTPEDPAEAVKEIRRWADHPLMVQVGVSLQSREPYGKPQFFAVWEASAKHGLPVAFHSEAGAGIDLPPMPIGHARTYVEYAAFTPLLYIYHLLSFISEGVFEALPDFKVVWAEGGADMLTPIMWRFDTLGRPHLEQTPWAPRVPSHYLPGHVWFTFGRLEGPSDPKMHAEWLELTGVENMLMHASNYPYWSLGSPSDLPRGITASQKAKILFKNAAGLYNFELGAAPSRSGETASGVKPS